MAHQLGARGGNSDAFLRNIAVLQKVLVRAKPFQSIDVRASRFLRVLDRPTQSVAFRLALEELGLHADLLDETSALHPTAPRLQARILESAPSYPAAERIAHEMFGHGGIAILVLGIIVQGEQSGTHQMRFEFPESPEDRIRHLVLTPIGWTEVLTMPGKLTDPIKGFMKRLDAVGYKSIRPYTRFKETQATSLLLNWRGDQILDIEVR